MQGAQTLEIHIAPIHHVESTRLYRQDLEHSDVAHLAVTDVNETGDISSQVQQGMQLNGGLGGAKRCPVEQTQTGHSSIVVLSRA